VYQGSEELLNMVGDLLYCIHVFQFLDRVFTIWTYLKVIFAMFTDGLIALAMNVIALRFTNAAYW
jgi:hypothetical protein